LTFFRNLRWRIFSLCEFGHSGLLAVWYLCYVPNLVQISVIVTEPTVRNLGVQLDSELSFDAYARNCVKSCYYHLRRINQIKRYVEQECLRSLVHAFITSRLDYCSSMYAHCHISTRQRLQRVQNRAACFVLSAPPRSSSLPLLQQLHWATGYPLRLEFRTNCAV